MRRCSYRLLVLGLATVLQALTGCTVAVVGGAAVATVAVVTDPRTTGTVIDDQGIEFEAYELLGADEALREQSHINVTSYNFSVLLTGEVAKATQRERAESLVAGIPRVQQVHNELRLAAPTSLTSRSRDALTTSRAKMTLYALNVPGFEPGKVKVVTENGIVYLLGLVTAREADAVVEKVRRVSGVQKVVKVFEIVEPVPENPTATAAEPQVSAQEPTPPVTTDPLR